MGGLGPGELALTYPQRKEGRKTERERVRAPCAVTKERERASEGGRAGGGGGMAEGFVAWAVNALG